MNTYRDAAELFVDSSILYSQEGITQGDPLAMPMYALAILPLIHQVNQEVRQVWYADDATATGRITALRDCWDKLVIGPAYGYHVNASKTWLITKESHHSTAEAVFRDTQVNITTEGKPHLGIALGSQPYIDQNVVHKWSEELSRLSTIANTQPHAAFAALTHGMVSKWTYISRTIPNVGHRLQPLEDIIRMKLIPALTGCTPPNDCERELFALPAKLGGIGLINPTQLSSTEYPASRQVSGPLYDLILEQDPGGH